MHTWFDQYKSNSVRNIQEYGVRVCLVGAESAEYLMFGGDLRFKEMTADVLSH
jgi:hypothetical protein